MEGIYIEMCNTAEKVGEIEIEIEMCCNTAGKE